MKNLAFWLETNMSNWQVVQKYIDIQIESEIRDLITNATRLTQEDLIKTQARVEVMNEMKNLPELVKKYVHRDAKQSSRRR